MMSALWLLLASLAAAGQAQAPPPLTAGAIAMLVTRSDDEARAALRAAIVHPDAAIRTVAARVAAVRRQDDLLPVLKAALAGETDPLATAEQKYALAMLQSPPITQAATPAPDRIRTLPLVAPGLLSSLMQIHGCQPTKYGSYGIARVMFDGGVGAAHAEIDPSKMPKKCQPVIATMVRLLVADEDPTARIVRTEYLLLPVDAEYVTCTDTAPLPPPPPGAPQPPRPGFMPPMKTRDIKPTYPDSALRSRMQGIVSLRAVLSAAGCMSQAEVDKGVQPMLDIAALRAVMGWRFDPARIAGVAVPFHMAATVSFSVR